MTTQDNRTVQLAVMRRIHERMRECPYRREKSCGAIDKLVKWPSLHRMPIDDCDACWAKGGRRPDGESSREAVDYRERYARLMLTNIVAHIEYAKMDVIQAVLAHHVTPEMRPQIVLRLAPRLGPSMATTLAAKHCPEAIPQIQTYFAAHPWEPPKPVEKVTRWLWMNWVGGTPWPQRPVRAVWAGLLEGWKASRKSWLVMKRGGCGCNQRAKAAVTKVRRSLRIKRKTDDSPRATIGPP